MNTQNRDNNAHNSLFEIRSATQRDLERMAEIITLSFHSHAAIFNWLEPLCRWTIYEDLRTRLQNTSKHYMCLVAIASQSVIIKNETKQIGEICGTVELALRSHQSYQPQTPYLSNLAVHNTYRRQGVAQKLLKTCEQTAKTWGFSEIYLHVLENNHQARRLYAKVGYRLYLVDWNLWSWLFRQPRRLLLRKSLNN
jgi:ribosomal protein S18 acetylase RimI-like enzyme